MLALTDKCDSNTKAKHTANCIYDHAHIYKHRNMQHVTPIQASSFPAFTFARSGWTTFAYACSLVAHSYGKAPHLIVRTWFFIHESRKIHTAKITHHYFLQMAVTCDAVHLHNKSSKNTMRLFSSMRLV